MFLPSSFFSSASSSSKAQLPSPRQPMILSQRSQRLKTAKVSMRMGKTTMTSGLMVTSPKKARKAAGGRPVIWRQLQQSGQATRARLMAVKSRLLAEECPRCRENTLQTLMRKIVCVTMQATQAVRQVFRNRPPHPLLTITTASRLAGARKRAKVASSAKKISAERAEVSAKRTVQQILRQRQPLDWWARLVVRRSSTNSSSWLSRANFSRMRFFTTLCRFAVDFLANFSACSSSGRTPANLKFSSISVSTVRFSATSRLSPTLSSILLMVATSSRMVSCSVLMAYAWRWQWVTSFWWSLRRKHSLGKEISPYPSRIVTRVSPKMFTRVAKTEGSCSIAKVAVTTIQTTMRTAPAQSSPMRMPFMIRDSLSLRAGVNSPESSNSCAKGRTSQQRKKLTQQMATHPACTRRRWLLSGREDSQMSMGRSAKQTSEKTTPRKTSSLAQRAAFRSEQQKIRKPERTAVAENSHQYTASILLQTAHASFNWQARTLGQEYKVNGSLALVPVVADLGIDFEGHSQFLLEGVLHIVLDMLERFG